MGPRLRASLAVVAMAVCAGCRDGGSVARDAATREAARDSVQLARDSAFADSVLRAAEDIGAFAELRTTDEPAPVRDANEIRLALQAYAADTYIGELFAQRDSMNFRWPERTRRPLFIWIQSSPLDKSQSSWPGIVGEAFQPWTDVGIPILFDFVGDSARADVVVTWVDRYESRTSGRTRWVRDQHGWITHASIEIARAQPDGRPLTDAEVRAVALHEVGHLLGLDHTTDATSIMADMIRVSELSEADRATVRLVYRLPPGSVRVAP